MTDMPQPDSTPRPPLHQVSRRTFLIGSAMAVSAAAAYAAKPQRNEQRLIKHNLADVIPRAIGPWSATNLAGMVVATEDQAVAAEGYDQLLTRVYRAEGMPMIMLLLAYGSTQGGSLQLHRPETCYPGQGFRLTDFADSDLDLGGGQLVSARRFTALRDERVERLTYWTRISDSFPRNTAQEYSSIFASVLRGHIADGLLVRISSLGADAAELDAAIANFAKTMVHDAGREGRSLLVGDIMAEKLFRMDEARNR